MLYQVNLSTSNIIPIHKKDKDRNIRHSYRPISLNGVVGKAMEKIIVRRVNFYLETNGLLAEEQVGFRSVSQHGALMSQSVKDALDY